MTPERKAYLAKCSEKEKWLRARIDYAKSSITLHKAMLNPKYEIPDVTRHRAEIQEWKYRLAIYRHELARLKGMDRVVVPRMAYIGFYGEKGGLCKCDKYVTDSYIYCPGCGRRILWEKVK